MFRNGVGEAYCPVHKKVCGHNAYAFIGQNHTTLRCFRDVTSIKLPTPVAVAARLFEVWEFDPCLYFSTPKTTDLFTFMRLKKNASPTTLKMRMAQIYKAVETIKETLQGFKKKKDD